MNAPISGKRCPIAPADLGSPEWEDSLAKLTEAFSARQGPERGAENAADYLWHHSDAADLRALGYCRQCGVKITLVQTGRCVYSAPCDHYRAQANLKRVLLFLAGRAAKLTDARQAALMALIGR